VKDDKAIHFNDEVKASIANIVASAFHGTISLGEEQNLGGSSRSVVARMPVQDHTNNRSMAVIAKQASIPTFFFNELAALRFLSVLDDEHTFFPALYGSDDQLGLLVMEKIGQGTRLDHLLLADNSYAAEQGLIEYAKLHGLLHALTIGKRSVYNRIRQEITAREEEIDSYYNYEWLLTTLHTFTDALNVTPINGTDDELAAIAHSLTHPGPFETFIQVDAAPDNILHTASGWKMIDFEGSKYGHALLEGAYCRMPFPTCWCVYRLPDTIMRRVEDAYRTELIKGCPQAADDTLFYPALVDACIAWALNFQFLRSLEHLLAQDRTLVALSDRQRFLLYLNAAVQATEEFAYRQATGGTLRKIIHKLGVLWPEASDPPYYPSFS
jgi:hypothetical protein